jgi:NAD(P)-dependent dehydrogenase (short-subunit alcohol dehydrogenase family)
VEFAGRVAVVTGGTGALGQAITRRLLAGGSVVAVPFVVPAEAEALRASLPAAERDRLHAMPADVADPAAIDGFVGAVLARHRRVDILVCAVGGFAAGDLVSTPPEAWNRMLTLNLTTTYLACRGALPAMLRARSGRVITIASRAVVPPTAGFLAYTVAKAGVIALTLALAREVAPHGITVNAVLPSTMDTPANRAAMPDADHAGWVSVDSVAAVVTLLAGDGARDVTGALIPV